MKLRFEIYEPDLNASLNPCDTGQGASVLSYTNVGLDILVDGTAVVSTADLSAWPNPGGSTTLASGLVVQDLDLTGTVCTLQIDFLHVWENAVVTIQVTKSGYRSFSNHFNVFGYDLGNAGAASGNPDFDIYLLQVSSAYSNLLAYANFIAYRRPFTRELHVYKNNSSSGSTIYEDTASTLLINGSNGVICNSIDIDITQTQTVSASDICQRTITVDEKIWFPELTLQNHCQDCGTNTCNTTSNSQIALPFMTFGASASDISQVNVNDVAVYPVDNLSIDYELINYAGTIVGSKSYDEYVGSPTWHFIPTGYSYEYAFPTIGDYVLKLCVSVPEKAVEVDITGVDLEVGKWYRITDNSGGADFTAIGAPNNNVGTEFYATGTSPTWGTGIVWILQSVLTCCKTDTVHVCDPYEITQDDCGQYTAHNYSFSDATLYVSEMQDNAQFGDETEYDLPAQGSLTFTYDTDSVYQFRVGNESKILIVDCQLTTCILEFIDGILCKPVAKTCDCGQADCSCFAKKIYDFNAAMAMAYTYFSKVHAEYVANYSYQALTPDKLSSLYTIKQYQERILEYCESCADKEGGCGCS